MDPQFVAAVAFVAGGGTLNISKFCTENKVSRTTFGKYVARFRNEGASGLIRRSTAPHTSPTRTSATLCELIIRARKELEDEGLDNGPISIRWRLEDAQTTPLPSRSTVYRILREHGQIVAEPHKRPITRRRFVYRDPNGLWQIDGMEFVLCTGQVVCILQILDDHSRLDVGSLSVRSENGTDAWRSLELAFEGYGVPARVLFDNGLAFSAKHRGGASPLERILADKGVQPITSTVHHPQTCGKNERVHRTLQKWLSKKPTPSTVEDLQVLLDEYRIVYNNRRHQSLDGRTPQQVFDATDCAAPSSEPIVLSGTATRSISGTGIVQFDRCKITIGRKWANKTALVHWRGDEVTIMVGDCRARTLTLDRTVTSQLLTKKSSTKS